jgi:hypothetical protein
MSPRDQHAAYQSFGCQAVGCYNATGRSLMRRTDVLWRGASTMYRHAAVYVDEILKGSLWAAAD